MTSFSGIWPALVTPLTSAGQVDVPATTHLVEGLLQTGIGGLYVCGGTGEGVLLDPALRCAMAETVIGLVQHHIPVMVHIGAITTEVAVELAKHASRVGADAISAIPPFYYPYSFRVILAHYQAIAAVSQVPLYAYYIPGSTGATFTADQILELCALEGVAGLKYTSQDLWTLSRLMRLRDPSRVNVLSGPDELHLPCLSLGCDGAIGTTYNFMPRLYVDLRQAYLHGDVEMARRLQFIANDIITVLLTHGVIAATKATLGLLGYAVGYGVPPMPRIEGEDLVKLRQGLAQAELFEMAQRPALYGPNGDPMRGKLA
jgi:N-acetylneuraminate lyase